jgi:hypothetical protein
MHAGRPRRWWIVGRPLALPTIHHVAAAPGRRQRGCQRGALVAVIRSGAPWWRTAGHAGTGSSGPAGRTGRYLVRNSPIAVAISATWVSRAKWPVSRSRTSASGSGEDRDRAARGRVPLVQQAAGGPDPWPVAGPAALAPVQDVAGGVTAEDRDRVVADVAGACLEQGNAGGDKPARAVAGAFRADPLLRRAALPRAHLLSAHPLSIHRSSGQAAEQGGDFRCRGSRAYAPLATVTEGS